MNSRRLIVKIEGKLPEHLKAALKGLKGYWDDLFMGYSLPIENSAVVMSLMKEFNGRWKSKEWMLPNEHIYERGRGMSLKYMLLLERLIKQEDRLLEDIERYEKNFRRKKADGSYDLPYAYHMYEEAPDAKEMRSDVQWWIEDNLHNRMKECKKLREELRQIGREIEAYEKGLPGSRPQGLQNETLCNMQSPNH